MKNKYICILIFSGIELLIIIYLNNVNVLPFFLLFNVTIFVMLNLAMSTKKLAKEIFGYLENKAEYKDIVNELFLFHEFKSGISVSGSISKYLRARKIKDSFLIRRANIIDEEAKFKLVFFIVSNFIVVISGIIIGLIN